MTTMPFAPAYRVRPCNRQAVRADGRFVLYWMIAARRTRYNFALEHAIAHAAELKRPLVVLEALRVSYPWASDRLHSFVLDGMADQAAALAKTPIFYYPYVEPTPGAGSGLLETLAKSACRIITDRFPCFFLPRMVAAAGSRVSVLMEEVDGNGLYPLDATDRVFTTAASFRRHLQKDLPRYLGDLPVADPLAGVDLPRLKSLPDAIGTRWPKAEAALIGPAHAGLSALPIDHAVVRSPIRGGATAAQMALERFVTAGLPRYADERSEPDSGAPSGLSPYLHFGHISVHEVFARVMAGDGWNPAKLAERATGKREGFWGASRPVEAFLDELITWREIGYNMTSHQEGNYDRYESLPAWARETLEEHLTDVREPMYELDALEAGKTYDRLWNASQRELVDEGRMHNYMRMLWGKKVLEWTPDPRTALQYLIELNNKYALDGRNPNSYSGIFWCLGRYDRAWGPERPIFGKVRYMSSQSTMRKLNVKAYLARHAPERQLSFR